MPSQVKSDSPASSPISHSFRGDGSTSSGSPVMGSVVSLASTHVSKASTTSNRGDYEIVLVNPADEGKFECPVCGQILRYPVQFEECGHRCCSSCLPGLMRVAPRCPIDQKKLDKSGIYADKALQKEIDSIQVKCSSHAVGCKWTGHLAFLQMHMEKCDFTLLKCPGRCGIKVPRCFVEKHLNEDCPMRESKCQHCAVMIIYADEVEHRKNCPELPINCPEAGCKKKNFPRKELENHLKNECIKHVLECPFTDAGCNYKCLRKDMQQHMKSTLEDHTKMVKQTMTRAVEEFSQSEKEFAVRLYSVKTKADHLSALYEKHLIWKIENFEELFQKSKRVAKPEIKSFLLSTSRQGYRFQMIASLYGDGCDQGQYVSLYVRICKGEYDDLLTWPFDKPITLTLLDQGANVPDRQDVSYYINPAHVENPASLEKPSGSHSPQFGTTRFIKFEDMFQHNRYIVDDAIFIQIEIHED